MDVVFDKSEPYTAVRDVASVHNCLVVDFHVVVNEIERSEPTVAFQTHVSRLVPGQTFVRERHIAT